MRMKYKAYRYLQILLHKFNLHHAPPNKHTARVVEHTAKGAIHETVICHHWCTWCGLRGDVQQIRLKEML